MSNVVDSLTVRNDFLSFLRQFKFLRQLRHIHRLPQLYLNQLLNPEVMTLDDIRIRLGSYISPAIKERMYLGLYESSELGIVKAKLSADDRVMEIGSGLGLLSACCAKKVGGENVFSYEANPSLEEPILENFSLNNVSSKLTMCAIGASADEIEFYIGENFWTSSTIPWKSGLKSIKVPVLAFNKEVEKIDPSFLIMDIEGGELDVMKTATFKNIRKIMLEVHPEVIGREGIESIIAILDGNGFKLDQQVSHKIVLFFER